MNQKGGLEMKKCNEINELMSLYIDDQLDDNTRKEFEEHIDMCGSCREEFDALVKVVDLCNSIDEVELPEGFRDELHSKLVAERERRDKRYKGAGLLNKYIKICSTVAACLIIAVFAGRFIANNYFLPARHDKSTKSTTTADMQQEEAAGAAQNAAFGAENFNDSEEIMEFSIAAEDGTHTDGGEIPGTSRHTGTNDRSTGYMLAAARSLINKNINVTFKVSDDADVQAQMDRIKEFALNNGVEISNYLSPCFTEDSEDSKQEEPVDATERTDVNKAETNVLYLKVRDEDYTKFIDLLKSSFGDLNMEIGNLETKDCTEILDDLSAQLQDLDKRIEELENRKEVSDPDELDKLKKEREVVWVEMENVQLDSNYTFITVELRTE